MRKIKFENGYYYHIYNRGVDKRDVFLCDQDYVRFIRSIREFNNIEPIGSIYEKDYREKRSNLQLEIGSQNTLSDIIAWCLNPNHFHFIIRQKANNGISSFMHRLGIGYTQYFNLKYKRSGALFQGRFKSTLIKDTTRLLHLSAYSNGNPEIHGITEDTSKYTWSSYQDYLGLRDGTMCNKSIILDEFNSINEYREFVEGTVQDVKQTKREY